MSDIVVDIKDNLHRKEVKSFHKRHRKIFAFLIALVILLVVLGGGLLFYRHQRSQHDARLSSVLDDLIASSSAQNTPNLTPQDAQYDALLARFQKLSHDAQGSGYAFLAGLYEARFLAHVADGLDAGTERSALYVQAADVLKQSALHTKGGMYDHFFDLFSVRSARDLSLIEGGFLLLQTPVGFEKMKTYLAPLFTHKTSLEPQARELIALAAFQEGDMKDARTYAAQALEGKGTPSGSNASWAGSPVPGPLKERITLLMQVIDLGLSPKDLS